MSMSTFLLSLLGCDSLWPTNIRLPEKLTPHKKKIKSLLSCDSNAVMFAANGTFRRMFQGGDETKKLSLCKEDRRIVVAFRFVG